ncbi:MAG: hypothetical protein ABF311_00420, partial [Polaribacter sp.]
MITNTPKFRSILLKALLKLFIAGCFIGLFKKHDLAIAVLLMVKICYNCYNEILAPKKNKNWLLLIGMLLTGFGGIVGETWGVTNGYWEYHEVTKSIPLWVPFAWMLAFHFLYKLERN